MKKRILALLLSMTLVLTTGTLTFAEDSAETINTEQSSENTDSQTATEGQNTTTVENTTNPENGTSSSTDSTDPEQQVQAVSTENTTGPQVGDTVWIKAGSKIYKSKEDTNGREITFPYKIKIKKIVDDTNGKSEWYEFEFVDLSGIIGNIFLSDYSYIKVADTAASKDEATNSKECNCENPPENLAQHADSCPRKQYVKSLITNENGQYKTADEIYAEWDSYDETTRTDILNMVNAYVPTEYDALLTLINGEKEDEEVVFVQYDGTTNNGVHTLILAPEGTFPEGTTLTVKDTDISADQLSSLVSDILGIVAVDISFGCQPDGNVNVTLNIPGGSIPTNANMVYIVHIGENGPEIITSRYLKTGSEGQSITFGTDSFSSYAAVFVENKYSSQKMSSVLNNNEKYSLHTFDVKLFDYDPEFMNEELRGLGDDSFLFRGFGATGDTGTEGVNNSAETYAKQGIVQSKLTNDLPIFNYVTNGTKTGEYLFGETEVNGKTKYDAKFQFVYNSETGYYQYNSAANHAQYNNSNNTIELYADTLSTQNKYLATLDLATHSGENCYNNISATNTSFKATAKKSSSNGRLDPYVQFAVPNEGTKDEQKGQAASDIDKIYIKAKIPAGVGTNKLQVFFNSGSGMNETESFIVDYTATGDWIEFVLDTEDCSAWSDGKRITNLRIDLFDENRGSMDSSVSYDIEIAQISLIIDYDNYVTRGGFYPFSEIEDSYPGNGSNFSYGSWEKLMQAVSTINALSSRSINNPTADATVLKEELYFGVVMEFDFYIPVGNKVNEEDLTYYFSGDDDLWVFIDNQLALDIGGGHGGISGNINLTTGESTVSNAVTVNGYNSNSGTPESITSNLDTSLTTPGKHTMKIFYMERCGSVSNCFMKFNLPQTPQGSVIVKKSVTDESGAEIDTLKSETYTFKISGTFAEGNSISLDVSNLTYKLFDTTTGRIETKTVGSDGSFTLTATQSATFDIDENYNITVEEIPPSNEEVKGYQYESTTVNSTKGLCATAKTSKDGEISFDFVNQYKPLYGKITIEKSGISELDNNGTTETQSSVFHVEGTSTTGVYLSMDVVIVGNGEKTIIHVPVGTYKVTELTDWTWRYDEQDEKDANVESDKTTTVKFENKRNEDKWLSGDCYAENWWGGTNGVIRKDKK